MVFFKSSVLSLRLSISWSQGFSKKMYVLELELTIRVGQSDGRAHIGPKAKPDHVGSGLIYIGLPFC